MTTSTAQKSVIVPQIGKYHLVAELARGGMGDVYLAASQGPGGFRKLHAVKELKRSLCDDESYVTMFLEEARLAARLIHPNIVQTNEVSSEGRRHFMVMEFLDGRSLHSIRKRLGGGLSVNAHLRVIAEALLGLHYAHDLRGFDGAPLGMVHRDISPLNVFVTFNGQAKVLDFGIAKVANSALHTKTGVLKGRIAYMSPEQANGAKVDRRADVYSAGVMIWEAAAGRRLWPRMSEIDILTRILREGPPTLYSVRPDIPDELNRICARAMAYRREDRYGSAADLLSDLELYLAGSGDATTMRDVASLVGPAFADERRKTDLVIEETLARVQRAPSSGVMPRFGSQLGVSLADTDVVMEASDEASLALLTPSSSVGTRNASCSQSAPATAASLPPALGARARSSAMGRLGIPTFAAGVLLLGGVLFAAAPFGARAPAGARATPMAAGANATITAASLAPPAEPRAVAGPSGNAADIRLVGADVVNPNVADQVRDAIPRRAAGVTPSPIQLQRTSCQPPYVIEGGKKHWRLECL